MFWDRIFSLDPFELLRAAFSFTLFSLVLAALLLLGVALARRFRSTGAPPGSRLRHDAHVANAQYVTERRTLGMGAIAVIVLFAVEYVIRGYVLDISDTVDWWRYATPVLSALLILAVLTGSILLKGTIAPERPLPSPARRTWITFSPRGGIIAAGAVALTFLITTIASGLASSPDDRGRYIYLEIPVANTSLEPMRPWFYGWAYGVPVIVCVAALIAVMWITLRSNAVRPFLRPETLGAEQRARVEIAGGVVHLATAAMLLSLGGAFRFIGKGGTYSQLTIDGDGRDVPYELTWRYANLAVAAGWLAPAMEVAAFVLLLMVARRLLRSRSRARVNERTEGASISAPVL